MESMEHELLEQLWLLYPVSGVDSGSCPEELPHNTGVALGGVKH